MNRIIKLMTLAFVTMSVFAVSCDVEEVESVPQQLEVTAHNISGQWQLIEWNEAALADGTYVYMDFVRNDKTYTMYQNFDSFSNVPHVVTGSFYIETDPELGAIIRGNYDHDSGDWAHRYIVKSLTSTEMIWVAKDDNTFIQKFQRVESIPVAPSED